MDNNTFENNKGPQKDFANFAASKITTARKKRLMNRKKSIEKERLDQLDDNNDQPEDSNHQKMLKDMELKLASKEKELLTQQKNHENALKKLKNKYQNSQNLQTNERLILKPYPIEKKSINFMGHELSLKLSVELFKWFDRWDSPAKKFFFLVAEKTNFGEIAQVPISRSEFNKHVHSKDFKKSREQLIAENIIECVYGRTETSKIEMTFYTLHIDKILSQT